MRATSTILKSKTLTLKELKSSDVTQQYVDWLNDPDVNKYLESRFTYQDNKKVTEFVKACQYSEVCFLFGIFIEDGTRHIGNIKIGPINTHHNYAAIGLVIGDKDSWGKGFASKAISMITEFSFKQLKLVKIMAGCYGANIGSKKAFEKSGYRVEGFFRSHVESTNGRDDLWEMSCFESDFSLLKHK